MQYMGGKGRIAPSVAAAILADTARRAIYLEPFVGGGWVAAQMVRHFEASFLGDSMPDLMLMWQGLQSGWTPPESVSRTEYNALRIAQPSAERAFAGYGLSFGGKWFGGYASNKRGDDFVGAARRGLSEKIARMESAVFACRDYRSWNPDEQYVVYCDPPYAGTTTYSGVAAFDSAEFWACMRAWSAAGAVVYVSEYEAPADMSCVWERPVRQSLAASDNRRTRTERLYRVNR